MSKVTTKPQRQKYRWGLKTIQIEAELYERFGIMADDDLAVAA